MMRIPAGFIPAAVLAALSLCGTRIEAAEMHLDPPDPVQGGFVVVSTSEADGTGSVQVFGRTFPLFPAEGGMRGLLPISLETPEGEYWVTAGLAGAMLKVRARDRGEPRRLKGLAVSSEDGASLRQTRSRFHAALSRITARAYWPATWRRPVPGRITARFGTLRFYEGGASWPHRGIDFSWPAGWPVLACAAGIARLAEPMGLYGNTVLVDHGRTLFTAYLHLTRIAVKQDQLVEAGQIIGTIGETGLAKGAHLHFGAYVGTIAIDPEELLAREFPPGTGAGEPE